MLVAWREHSNSDQLRVQVLGDARDGGQFGGISDVNGPVSRPHSQSAAAGSKAQLANGPGHIHLLQQTQVPTAIKTLNHSILKKKVS